MIISHAKKVQAVKIQIPEARNISRKVLISPEEGWEDHVMRVFELGKGGHTPGHSHAWPHINYMQPAACKDYLDWLG